MSKVMLICVLVCCTSISVGCASRQTYIPPAEPMVTWGYDSISNPIENKDFKVYIEPVPWYPKTREYRAFSLKVLNKTNKIIEVVWNKTYFLLNGNANGCFMFEGVMYKDRNNPIHNDIVFENTTLTRIILPNNLVTNMPSWLHKEIPLGEVGIYITVKVEEIEISEKASVKIWRK